MANKKDSTPVLEIPEKTDEKLETEAAKLDAMRAELEKLKAENEKLRRDSVAAYSTAGARSDKERVDDACKKCAEAGTDPWTETISVRAPRKPAKEDPFYWLSVNGRTMQVPANDRYFDLPLPFAACLMDMIAAEWLAADYSDKIENWDPVTNPKKE